MKNKKTHQHFLIVSYAAHKEDNHLIYSYEPYIREMNLWLKYVDEVRIIAPKSEQAITSIEASYQHAHIKWIKTPTLDTTTISKSLLSLLYIPYIKILLMYHYIWATHIHIRCPGNLGLLAVLLQIFFPFKKKTVKYANNWDPKSKQPCSYKLQRKIIQSTVLSHNIQVLVYGNWSPISSNIKPFFTASYSEKEKEPIDKEELEEGIKIVFIGTLTPNKRPQIAAEALSLLLKDRYKTEITFLGDGIEKQKIKHFFDDKRISEHAHLMGNVNKQEVIEVLKKSHFLIFASQTEGWPKAVAESMWWGCIPITTRVSCVNEMLDNGTRGTIINPNAYEAAQAIIHYYKNRDVYINQRNNCIKWARQYTLERFEAEIKELI